MGKPFIGSEAVTAGRLTPYALRTKFVSIYRDVYVPPDTTVTAVLRAEAAWLWSRRRGIVAGHSASALHGAKWVDGQEPAELIYQNRHAPTHVRTWADRIEDDEIAMVRGMPVTSPARTAFDLACRNPVGSAVAAVDALARATGLKVADAELVADRYKGHRNIRRARRALDLVDAGAQSPRETWLRLLVIEAGYPRPETQIPVYGEYGELVAVVDMGWESVKIALEYEGEHHRTDRRQLRRDIERYEALDEMGWVIIRVMGEHTRGGILARLAAAWNRRT
ncbi:hypothetical protein AWB91_18055 [Mycobacterium paraense]|uniref:AbiEi antitoxin C-terminal domain-containing protein n=1 Tax=Mycobacterium paraense TaxID=767916 RepID=A0ABX3VP13_9MYCO|nr:type IV toxin-antitoxin system AbiEi family antitoxin [Mycobacterium paraense]ORW30880.1 hypothetical protein AWB91_18055 [Mycobacterium paraense]ORW42389.1 hypothetical protein AWB88_10070 [Mycobacterium paraense]